MMQIIETFFEEWPQRGLGDKITKYYTHFKGDCCTMNFIRKEFDKNAEFLTNKMLENPVWAINKNKKFEEYTKKYFICAEKLSTSNLLVLSDKQLINLLLGCKKYHLLFHGVAGSLTWQADADAEIFTRAVIKIIDKRIEEKKLKLKARIIFPTLSTPIQNSYMNKEERSFLEIASKIEGINNIREIFINKDTDDILDEINKINKKIYKLIYDHFKKYRWLSYQYKGPAADLSYYLGRWQTLFKSGASPKKLLDKLNSEKKKVLIRQNKLMELLDFGKNQSEIIKLSKYMVYIKDYRKAVLFYGMFCSENILKEIGKRLYLSLDQVRTMSYDEIKSAVLNKDFNVDDLNERLKECIYYYEKNKYAVYTGEEIKEFLAGVEKEKIKIKETKELLGTIACSGKVRGVVKVINIPEEMNKMKKGDIMVARTTNPNLVPAMAKAAGLISEDGGLTCHTAIVAREMRKPCLVGVKFVTKILKDGDKVEVDADNGKINIIS